MNIIKNYPAEIEKRELVKMIKSPNTHKVSDMDGAVITIEKWVIFEDTDQKTGEVKKVLVLKTIDDELVGTISPTFINEFESYVDIIGDDLGSIQIVTGESKAGRKYVTMALA